MPITLVAAAVVEVHQAAPEEVPLAAEVPRAIAGVHQGAAVAVEVLPAAVAHLVTQVAAAVVLAVGVH